MVIECPQALRSRSGAAILTSPRCLTARIRASNPGAWAPSSLVARIRMRGILLVGTAQNRGMGLLVVAMAAALGSLGPAVVAFLDQWRRPVSSWLTLAGGSVLAVTLVASLNGILLWPGVFLAVMLSLVVSRLGPWAMACVFASGLVGVVSGGAGGAGPLRDFLISRHMNQAEVEFWVLVIRKTVHVTAYGSFALAVTQLMKRYGTGRFGVWPALAWVASLACFDEFRQSFTPGRTGQFVDVLIDLAGATAVLVVVQLGRRGRQGLGFRPSNDQ